jgi:sarcosine oxidase
MSEHGREWEVIVVGLGAIGSAAAYWASTRPDTRILGLEQFELGHANGASADHSRIIRLSYHRPDYVRLAKRAFETWAAVEAEAGERIVTVTGGLDLWPADPAIPMADYTGSLAAEAVPFEILDAAEVMRRWPQWHLPDDVTALWQSRAGLADPYRGNAAHRRLATDRGATLADRTRVTAIREVGGAFEVDAGGVTHEAGRVVLAADAWTNDLLAGFDRRLPLTVTKEQVTYFAAPDPEAFAPDRFPVWIWMDEPSFYGIPTYGEAGPKAAQDAGGQPTTPETRTFERDEAMYDRVRQFVETYLPAAAGPELHTKTCLYTLTPDRDFVVDGVPDVPGLIVGLGAGHGFKFASVLGRVLVEMALDGASPSDGELGAFHIDRPILLERDPATSWLV